MDKRGSSKIKRLISLVGDKHFLLAFLILLIAYLGTYLSSSFLMNNYGDKLPVLNDIILDNLPYLRVAFIYDFLMISTTFIFIFSAIKYDLRKLPYFILMFGISHIIRSIFIILTPFGNPNGAETGIFSSVNHLFGVYPSGHTITAFLAFAFSKGNFKKINFVFLILIPIALLLGRGHYSIDIFSGLLFGYAIYQFGEKHFRDNMQANIKG